MLVKEGEEAPSAASRQHAERDAQAARRAGSYTSPLDKAMGPSGEGMRLQELVILSRSHLCPILLHRRFKQARQCTSVQGRRCCELAPQCQSSLNSLLGPQAAYLRTSGL